VVGRWPEARMHSIQRSALSNAPNLLSSRVICHPEQSFFALRAKKDCRGTWVFAGARRAMRRTNPGPSLVLTAQARLGAALGMTGVFYQAPAHRLPERQGRGQRPTTNGHLQRPPPTATSNGHLQRPPPTATSNGQPPPPKSNDHRLTTNDSSSSKLFLTCARS
jgi:hypothetical protein